jgi:hypothetical protein
MKKAAALLALWIALSQGAQAAPDAKLLVEQATNVASGVNDYEVDITINVHGSGVSVNNMRMTYYYKKPGKMKLTAKEGMGVIPSGLLSQTALKDVLKRTRAEYVGTETRAGGDCYRVRLTGAPAVGIPDTLDVWLDAKRSVIVATDISKKLNMSTEWKYSLVNGKYLLVSEITAKADGTIRGRPQRYTATVRFRNYKLNKGIPDSVFKEVMGKPLQGRPFSGHP